MTQHRFSILNLSLDRGLLDTSKTNETQLRQLFYCREIPARIVHLVKATKENDAAPLVFGEEMRVVPCAVPHWSLLAPLALLKGFRILRREKFDFIQVQEPYLTGLVGLVLSALFRTPLICGLYSDEVNNPVWLQERFLNRLANGVAKFVLRRSRAARADSLAVAQRVGAGRFCPATFIPFLITHADRLMTPQPQAAQLRARLLEGRDGPLLLAVNRLEPEKNIPLMLRAFAKALKERPGLTLAIAGTGRLESELKTLADEIAPNSVRWLGWVKAEEMAACYQACDLMLISSDRESAARVLSESLFAGTPVLTTDTAGAREVIEDGRSGRIVPVSDETAFATALCELAANPALIKEMGLYGRQQMESRMTGPAVAAALRDFYTEARHA